MTAEKIICPECGSVRVWAKGRVPTRSGPKQRYVCFACGRTFYKPAVKVHKSIPKPKANKKDG